MKRWDFNRSALTSFLAAALLAGCGGSQAPIAGPGAMPQNRALATRGDSASYQVLYSFQGKPNDGAFPVGSLVDIDGTLYGATREGGSDHRGTVFSVTTGGTEKLLHSFTAAPDGSRPAAGLIDVKGILYGTTFGGGGEWRGTVYSITTGGVEEILHRFEGKGTHGGHPVDPLVDVGGTFYGTTTNGGFGGRRQGTVFSLTMSGTEKVLHSFGKGTDGSEPFAPLVDVGGTLYGTTLYGGTYGHGTFFSITTNGTENVLYSFGSGTDASGPGDLIDVGGTLYGTAGGGTYSNGAVFSITTSGAEKVLYSFRGSPDGAGPEGILINVNGTLYGATYGGGSSSCGCGTVYSISTSGAETVVYDFTGGSNGAHPGGLLDVSGVLYGTTANGGKLAPCRESGGCGTVFALTP